MERDTPVPVKYLTRADIVEAYVKFCELAHGEAEAEAQFANNLTQSDIEEIARRTAENLNWNYALFYAIDSYFTEKTSEEE